MGARLPDLLDDLTPHEADRLREVWTLAGPAEPAAAPSQKQTEEALADLRASRTRSACGATDGRRRTASGRTASGRTASGRRKAVAGGRVKRWMPVLGVLVVVATLAYWALAYWWMQPAVYTAPVGKRRAVTLPDGSRVELNSGSELRYRKRLAGSRHARLRGEAFFVVTKKNEAPFVVETFNAKVRVTGTRFGVRAWPGEPASRTTVALKAGQVVLTSAGTRGHRVRVAPGEAWHVMGEPAAGAQVARAGVSVEAATAWRRGDFVFKDAPLGAVAREVERRFGTALQVRPDSLRHQHLNLALRHPDDAEAVVRDLALALGLRYSATATGYEVHPSAP